MSPYDAKLMGEQPPLTGRAAFESAQRVHAALSLTIDEGYDHGDHMGMQNYRRAVETGQAEMLSRWGESLDAEAAALQIAREKLLATAMVAVLPTDDTTKLRMVLRLAQEAEDALTALNTEPSGDSQKDLS